VLEAYQAGITSLKNMTINIDEVEETMDQLEEVSHTLTSHTPIVLL